MRLSWIPLTFLLAALPAAGKEKKSAEKKPAPAKGKSAVPPKAKVVAEDPKRGEKALDGPALAVSQFLHSWFGTNPSAASKFVAEEVVILAGDSLLAGSGVDTTEATVLSGTQFLAVFGKAFSSSLATADAEGRAEAARQLDATTYAVELGKNGEFKIPAAADAPSGSQPSAFKMAAEDRVVVATDAEKNQAFMHLKKNQSGQWVICGWLVRD